MIKQECCRVTQCVFTGIFWLVSYEKHRILENISRSTRCRSSCSRGSDGARSCIKLVVVMLVESVVMEGLMVEINICAVKVMLHIFCSYIYNHNTENDFLKKTNCFYIDELLSSRPLASIHFIIT